MKKTIAIAILLATLSTSLFAFGFGYGLSIEGYSGFNQSSSTRLSLIVDPTPDRYLTLEVGAGVGFRDWSMVFTGLNAELSLRTFSLSDHIFSFLFLNTTVWSPRFSAGVIWDMSWNLGWKFAFSPFNFMDVHFNYEFLRPFVIFDKAFSFSGWGIDLVRVSYLF